MNEKTFNFYKLLEGVEQELYPGRQKLLQVIIYCSISEYQMSLWFECKIN